MNCFMSMLFLFDSELVRGLDADYYIIVILSSMTKLSFTPGMSDEDP